MYASVCAIPGHSLVDISWVFHVFWHNYGKNGAGFLYIQQPHNQEKGTYYMYENQWLSLCLILTNTSSQAIKDWHLFVFIAVLIIVDLVILVTYTIVLSVNGDLSASKNENVEHPYEAKGVSCPC